jgi:spore maturation protein CgeB
VYQSLGRAAFMLHPYCRQLTEHYAGGREIVYYHNREELHDLIKYYRTAEADRLRVAKAAYLRTAREHTYLERVRALMEEVRKL